MHDLTNCSMGKTPPRLPNRQGCLQLAAGSSLRRSTRLEARKNKAVMHSWRLARRVLNIGGFSRIDTASRPRRTRKIQEFWRRASPLQVLPLRPLVVCPRGCDVGSFGHSQGQTDKRFSYEKYA